MKKTTFCLVFICRDNEKTIEKMLNSALPHVDEVVACDTGSKDKTKELIKKFDDGSIPFHIFNDKWENFGFNRSLMFSNARKVAKADYFLMIDSDAELKVLDEVGELTADYYSLTYNFAGSIYSLPMVFKNNHDWRYSGYAHNVLVTEPGMTSDHLNSFMMIEPGRNKKDDEAHLYRTFDLLKKQIDEGNATPRTNFYFARTASGINRELSIRYHHKVIEGLNWSEEKYVSYCDLADLEPEKIIFYCLKAFEINPNRAEAFYKLGLHFNQNKMYNSASMVFEKILTLTIPQGALFSRVNIYEYLRHFEYAVSLYWIKKFDEAYIQAKIVEKASNVSEHILKQNKENLGYILKHYTP